MHVHRVRFIIFSSDTYYPVATAVLGANQFCPLGRKGEEGGSYTHICGRKGPALWFHAIRHNTVS